MKKFKKAKEKKVWELSYKHPLVPNPIKFYMKDYHTKEARMSAFELEKLHKVKVSLRLINAGNASNNRNNYNSYDQNDDSGQDYYQ